MREGGADRPSFPHFLERPFDAKLGCDSGSAEGRTDGPHRISGSTNRKQKLNPPKQPSSPKKFTFTKGSSRQRWNAWRQIPAKAESSSGVAALNIPDDPEMKRIAKAKEMILARVFI
jgi:hypothetical protein